MPRFLALFTILFTTFAFTIIGVAVAYLMTSAIHQSSRGSPHVADVVPLAYIGCTVGGTVAGLFISCFAVWLVGLDKS